MQRRRFLVISTAAASAAKGAGADGAVAPLVSFGLITDVQYADAEPQGERHFRASLPKLQAAVADLAREQLAFTLHPGDLIERDFASFAAVLPVFDGLGHPVRQVLGNHDFAVADAEKARVVPTLGMPSGYYQFDSCGVRFLILDTNEVSTYRHPAGSTAADAGMEAMQALAAAGQVNAKPWNGGISPTQLEWLDRQLGTADAARQPVIVCGHHPLLPEEGHHTWNHREIIAVLKRHPAVRAYFCGHQHAGAQVISDGVPYITFKSLLHEPDVTAYCVVRLFADRLVIEGRGREESRVIQLSRWPRSS